MDYEFSTFCWSARLKAMFHYAMNLAALLLSGFLRMFGIVYVKVEYAKTAKIKKINIFHQLLEHY